MPQAGFALPLTYTGLTALALLVLPLAVLLAWKKKARAPLGPVWAGALSFFLFSKVLEGAAHLFCIVQDNPVSRAIGASPWLFTLYGCAMAGIFEEVGRYAVFSTVLKKYQDPQTALGYGIGHGGIEVYLNMLLPVAAYFAVGLAYLKGGEGAVGDSLPLAQAAGGFTLGYGLLVILERVGAMAVHLIFSVVVFWAARHKSLPTLLLAVLLHGLVDVPPGLYQYGALNMPLTEGLFLLLVAAMIPVGLRYWRRLKAPGGDGGDEGPSSAPGQG